VIGEGAEVVEGEPVTLWQPLRQQLLVLLGEFTAGEELDLERCKTKSINSNFTRNKTTYD